MFRVSHLHTFLRVLLLWHFKWCQKTAVVFLTMPESKNRANLSYALYSRSKKHRVIIHNRSSSIQGKEYLEPIQSSAKTTLNISIRSTSSDLTTSRSLELYTHTPTIYVCVLCTICTIKLKAKKNNFNKLPYST